MFTSRKIVVRFVTLAALFLLPWAQAGCSNAGKTGFLVLELHKDGGFEPAASLRITLGENDVRTVSLASVNLSKSQISVAVESPRPTEPDGTTKVMVEVRNAQDCTIARSDSRFVQINAGVTVTLPISVSFFEPLCGIDANIDVTTDASNDVAPSGSCLAGSYHSDPLDAIGCIPWTVCEPGTFVVEEGSSTKDRVCNGCLVGTYSPAQNVSLCMPWTACTIGKFIESRGTSTNDQACLTCADGKFTAVENSSACAENGTCAPGTEMTASAVGSTPPVCVECTAGTYCAGGSSPKQPCMGSSWDHDGRANSACVEKTICVAGQFATEEGSATIDRKCGKCPSGRFSSTSNATECTLFGTCTPGQFVTQAATATSNQACSECASGKFSNQPNSPSCSDWKNCDSGTYVSGSPSSTSNRACAMCPSGKFSSQANQSSCVEQGACAAGTEQVTASTTGAPAVCAACAAGTFCAGGIIPKQTCSSAHWDNDGNSATACADKTKCGAGYWVSNSGSATTDRTCSACVDGTFSSNSNAVACSPLTPCMPGESVSGGGTKSADRTCVPCKGGEFSSVSNAPNCSLWSDCQPGRRATNTPTPKVDRSCADCFSGEYTSQPNQASCLPQGSCAAGTVQTAKATVSMPPICEACGAGVYCAGGDSLKMTCAADTWDNDQNSATPCVGKLVCSAGSAIASNGTSTTNRTCPSCLAGTYCAGGTASAVDCSGNTWDHDAQPSTPCQNKSPCGSGYYVTSDGSSTTDRMCAPSTKQVPCDINNSNPQNSIDTVTNVAVTYTNGVWSAPRQCAWECNLGYAISGNSCVNSQQVSCDTNNGNPVNSTDVTVNVTIVFANGAWSSPSQCSWACSAGFFFESGTCINSKQVSCDTANSNPGNSADNVTNVTVTWSSAGGWTAPAKCGWSCNQNFGLENGFCINTCDGFAMPNPVVLGLPNPASYDATVSGTVTDKVTGLAWEHPISASTVNQASAIAYCNSKGSGWRLPSIVELVSLIDNTKTGPMIDTTAFSGSPASKFWTSVNVPGQNAAWFVDFNSGETYQDLPTVPLRVRCVSQVGSRCYPPPRFAINGAEVVDGKSGLIWQRGTASASKTWTEAVSYCPTLGSGFRLPSVKELSTLVDYSKPWSFAAPYIPMIDATAFPSTPGSLYWTSSTLPSGSSKAWVVNFLSGYTYTGNTASEFLFQVRCVR